MAGHWNHVITGPHLPGWSLNREGSLSFEGGMALKHRVRVLHHWLRKGEADKAARAAREAAHVANALLARIAATGER